MDNKMKLSLKATLFLLTIIITIILTGGANGKMNVIKLDLPKTVGVWNKPDSPRVVTSEKIFKYMNGAGELYLGYRFRHLEVFDYTSGNQDNILVELYFMESSDDAYGLLSLDWGGEPVSFRDASANTSIPIQASPTTALYGAGLLRVWSDNLYARVMAYSETPASKKAVFALGHAIAKHRKKALQPKLVNVVSPQVGSDWKLRADRLSFFRSYLVLNSIYYLSEKNILNLDLSTAAVVAPYEQISNSTERKRSRFLVVKYENQQHARQALNHFHGVYLPEFKKEVTDDSATESPSLFKLEDGWLAYKLIGNYITVVFECPDQESARQIIQKNESNLLKQEGES
jgi:hypothetical protein